MTRLQERITMRTIVGTVLAGFVLALGLASPAFADADPGRSEVAPHPSRSRHHVWRHPGRPDARYRVAAAPGAALGPRLAPSGWGPTQSGWVPPQGADWVELRKPYLPVGVVYNVPAEPLYPPRGGLYRDRGVVLHARY